MSNDKIQTEVKQAKETKEIKLDVLVPANRLAKIPYSDKPLTDLSKIQYLTPEQLESKFGIVYTESLHGNKGELQGKYIGNDLLCEQIRKKPDAPSIAAVRERLKNPLGCLVLCNFGVEVGHGIVTSEDIEPNTVLFMYAGTVENAKSYSEGDSYTYTWASPSAADSASKVVSGLKRRGLSSWMQHCPIDKEHHKEFMQKVLRQQFGSAIEAKGIDLDEFTQPFMAQINNFELEELTFKNQKTRKNIAISNVKVSHVVLDGMPVVVCWSEYGIKKFQQVAMSYGEGYWATAGFRPRYFTVDHNLIPLNEYSYKQSGCSAKIALPSMKPKNPYTLYKEGIEAYQDKQYDAAIKILFSALEIFKVPKDKVPEEKSLLEQGNCHSALASSFREMKNIDEAIKSCEQAIICFANVNPGKLEAAIKKHKDCLALHNKKAGDVYGEGINNYKNRQYHIALNKFLFAVEFFSSGNEKATCHSTLASCYRDLGNINKAIEHAEAGLALCDGDEGLASKLSIKLDALKAMSNSTQAHRPV